MADYLKGLFRGAKPSAAPVAEDSDFADFAKAPEPTPASLTATETPFFANPSFATGAPVPYTKWYRVWERTSLQDFKQEAFIIPFLLIVIGLHFWGRRVNKRKARNWAAAHAPLLQKEFALIGFGDQKSISTKEPEKGSAGESASSEANVLPEDLIKEKTAQEFVSYASGRQNIAFLDVRLEFFKRYNPLTLFIEWVLSLLFESFPPPVERMTAIAYTFDGKEKDIVPVRTEQQQAELESRVKGLQSSYDGFVWAIVHKDAMRRLRDERYDISLTFTKDNPKLPNWATVMSESAEVTDFMLTDELVKAVTEAGEERFENLIITDQPIDKPQKLNETTPRKRLTLTLSLPSSSSSSAHASSIPLFALFLHLPDILASTAHFRPEVLRRIKATRDEEIRKLRKQDDEEKAEERKLEADRKKKAERDAKLKGLSAEEQRKYLDKERERDQKRQQKKMTKRG